jgi:uncharacterized membrane protein
MMMLGMLEQKSSGRMSRMLRHLSVSRRAVRKAFGPEAAYQIQELVREREALHAGEIMVVIEATLQPREIFFGKSGRERALEIFSERRVWDTERNNGVLLYVLFADRDIEILADRGIARVVPDSEWQRICALVEGRFKEGEFVAGVKVAVGEISARLAEHFPETGARANELSNRPVLIW